jgi:hypothetical protein
MPTMALKGSPCPTRTARAARWAAARLRGVNPENPYRDDRLPITKICGNPEPPLASGSSSPMRRHPAKRMWCAPRPLEGRCRHQSRGDDD